MTYVCANCGGTFESTWTEEEARAEEMAAFGVAPSPNDAIVCDDCYWKLVAAMQN